MQMFRGWFLKCIVGAACVAILLVAVSYAVWGSPRNVLLVLRGEPLVLDPAKLDLGEGSSGSLKDMTLKVTNLGRSPVNLVGATMSCDCIQTDTLPLEVPAGGSRQLSIRASFSGESRFEHTLVYYTSCSSQPELVVKLSGKVLSKGLESIAGESPD